MGFDLILAASSASWGIWTLNVLLVLIGLNLVILVHELGHFIVARLCGVKCEKFYIWFDIFGWKLFKFKRGETEYGLGVLPLGGYVKMLGQEDNPARLKEEIERAKAQRPDPSESLGQEIASAEQALYDPRSYLAKSVPKRMAIISAGVTMNVVFAFVAAAFAYGLGVEQTDCVVGAVFAGDVAWQANLRVGDRIERVAGKPIRRFEDVLRTVSVGKIADGVTMDIRRPDRAGGEERFQLTVKPKPILDIPMIGIGSCYTTSLHEDLPVLPGSPAALARPAFQPGDRFVRIGDVPITSYVHIHSQLALHPDEPLKITVQRTLGQPKSDPDTRPATKEITIEVPPSPMRRLGLVMEMGPVVAVQADSPAARAGIKPGDRIRAIDGQPPGDPMTLPDRLRRLAHQKSQITITIKREGETDPIDLQVSLRRADWYWTPFELDAHSPMSIPALGVVYPVLNRVREVEQGSPAAKAGLQGGEVVVQARLIPPDPEALAGEELGQVGGEFEPPEVTVDFDRPKANWPIVSYLLQQTLPGTRVELNLKDGRTLTLTPAAAADWFNPDRGFVFKPLTFTQTAGSVSEAITLGMRESWDSLTLIFRTLRSLGTGQVPLKALSGPVGIFRAAVSYASRGLSSLLIFLCLLSANLAVLNFIPIPVLDGGHMIFLSYEGIRGKPPSEGVLTTLTFGGLVLLLTLMIWVTGLDISRLFGQ